MRRNIIISKQVTDILIILKRHNLKLVKLSGELNTLSEEEYEQLMVPFRDDLQQLMTKYDVKEEHIFNADQPGNYALPYVLKIV